MNQLLVIAADQTVALRLTMDLEGCDAFRASHAVSLAEAIARAMNGAAVHDAVLIHVPATADNIASQCGRIRQVWPHCPVLVLAEQGGETSIVAALDAGASDVVVVPYRAGELRARLHAQIRAHANSAAASFAIGQHRFNPATRVLQDLTSGSSIRLTHKETEVLKYLNRSNGQPVTRQALLRDVWGYREGADSYTVESHMYRLRRKIETDPGRPRLVVNESGGYALITNPGRGWAHLREQPRLPPRGGDTQLRLAG